MLHLTKQQYQALINRPAPSRATTTKRSHAAPKVDEDELQVMVANHLRENYPAVLFDGNSKNTDLPAVVASQMKAMGKCKGYPDIFIAAPRHGFHGCYLELKREGVTVWKRNGELRQDEHLAEQSAVHKRLRGEGYFADFVVGYEDYLKVIKLYLGGIMVKYPLTNEIKKELEQVTPIDMGATDIPEIMASLHYGMALMYRNEIKTKSPQADLMKWVDFEKINLGKAKHYYGLVRQEVL